MRNRLSLALAAVTLILGLSAAGCGSRQSPTVAPTPVSASIHRQATNPSQQPSEQPSAAPARSVELAKPVAEGDSESVSDATFTFSPIARAVAATLPTPSATPIPARWVENTHYTKIVPSQPTSVAPDKVEVLEVFWYGCPHCFHLDPALENWNAKSRPSYVSFSRVPVMWAGNTANRAHARLFYTMEALGKLNTLHAEVFHEIHVVGNPLVDMRDPAKTEKMQKDFLLAHGVSEADFDRTYRSFLVETKLQQAEQLTLRYKVTGVPALVVNGKYMTDIGSARTEADLLTLLNDLAASEHHL